MIALQAQGAEQVLSDTPAGDCRGRPADQNWEAPPSGHLPASLLICFVVLLDGLALGLGCLAADAVAFGYSHRAAANDGALLLMVPLAITFGAWRGAYQHPGLCLADQPIDIYLVPELLDHQPRQDRMEAAGIRLVQLAVRPISGLGGAIKMVEDYILALTALAVAAMPMALITLAIWLDSPGPVLFRQTRTGFRGRELDVFKFRTMYCHAADPTGRHQVRDSDPRVTRVGAILRRTSLDELPQIFNVLRGEMSIVGPRPHALDTHAGSRRFDEVMAHYAARHRVRPGLTSLAQVRDWRGLTDTEEKLVRRVESDLEYIENWSVWLDLTIVLRTLVAVTCMRNTC